MEIRNLTALDNVELVTFNALNSDPLRQGISSTARNIANEQITFCGYLLHNNDATLNTWVQVYFKPANQVTVGSTIPDMTIKLTAGVSVAWDFLSPIRQGTGLSIASTTTEIGSTAPTSATTGSILIKKKHHQSTPTS